MINALEYLKIVAQNKSELKHYKRRCDLAQEYYDYYTGNLNGRLQRLIARESEIEFDQRINLTNHVSSAILNSAKLPFQKAARKQPLIRKIDFNTESDKRAKEVKDFMSVYNGKKSLDQYLEQMVIEYNFIDPNAFLITEFLPNTELKKAKPYPFIAQSQYVVDYNYNNGILDYVIIRLPITFIEKGKEKPGFKYTMYNGNESIVFEQVAYDEQEAGAQYFKPEEREEKFKVTIYNVQAENDPDLTPAAIQFGYIVDPETNYETYLSIFHCALPYLRKTLKTNSELDQSMAMMAFPQRYRYVPDCNNDGCYHGKMADGKDCEVCGGTGKAKVHKGAQDIQEFSLPKDPTEIFDLARLAYDHSPNIDLLKFQDEYIKSLKVDIHTTIFNNDIFVKPTITQTATQSNIEVDNMNDTLFSFCRRFSQIWQHAVYFIAVFTDNVKRTTEGSDIIIQHKYPSDLKLKSLGELMADLKAAYDSKASVSTISAIEDDINEILYSDRPDELKKIHVQQLFSPFKGYTPDDIRYFFSSGLTTKFNQILYSNYANIWLDLEKEFEDPWIYDLAQPKIWEILKKKVSDLIAEIEAEKPQEVTQLNLSGNEIPTE